MRLSIALAAALLLQEEKVESLYKFKPGTTWAFEATAKATKGPRISKYEFKLEKEKDGKVELEAKITEDNGEPRTESMLWFVKDGYLVWAQRHEEVEKDSVRVYKLGSKKGDTWEWEEGKDRKAKGTHLGTETVKVLAGTYKDVVRIRLDLSESRHTFAMEVYLAPGVGPVKLTASAVENDWTVIELKEFKPQK